MVFIMLLATGVQIFSTQKHQIINPNQSLYTAGRWSSLFWNVKSELIEWASGWFGLQIQYINASTCPAEHVEELETTYADRRLQQRANYRAEHQNGINEKSSKENTSYLDYSISYDRSSNRSIRSGLADLLDVAVVKPSDERGLKKKKNRGPSR